MSILVIGVNHRSAPLAVLERVSLPADEISKAVERLAARDNVREVAVISTCNRTEVYAVAERFHGAYADIRDFLCEAGDIGADELHPHLYSFHDDDAVRHLFEVAAGLDSAVIGETEILGQVRTAWELAQHGTGARTTMNLLFRRAIGAGKRARSETGIARGTASISHAAVEMAVERLGGLAGRRVAVVGAGAMGEGIAVALARSGAGDVTVVNRTPERGAELARRVEGRAAALH
jgi:glutamyl-tRNA reductase